MVVGVLVLAVVAGTVTLAGAIVPEAVVIGCTLADAGIGKVGFEVGVELVLPAICLCMLIARAGYSRSSIAASASRSTSSSGWAASIGRIRSGSARARSS